MYDKFILKGKRWEHGYALAKVYACALRQQKYACSSSFCITGTVKKGAKVSKFHFAEPFPFIVISTKGEILSIFRIDFPLLPK